MAASTSALVVVGGWVTNPPSLKATTPISTESGWRSTKARAAVLAASIRVGSRSSARMLFDTSKARITVPSRRGSPTLTSGRPKATTKSTRAPRNSANGTWRSRLARRAAGVGANPCAASSAARRS